MLTEQRIASTARAWPGMAAVCTAAADAAAAVDAEAAFPAATLSALRAHSLLTPVTATGSLASWDEQAELVSQVSAACGSSGLIFAMHLSMVAILDRHVLRQADRTAPGSQARAGMLLAGCTSEAGTGGDIGISGASLQPTATGWTLDKDVPVASYVEQADALLVTARRSPASAASDQVLVLLPRDHARVTPTSVWVAMGMRGTASIGARVEGQFPDHLVFEESFAVIRSATMLPVSHTLWAACWRGIARAAWQTTQTWVREQRRTTVTDVEHVRAAEIAERLWLLEATLMRAVDRLNSGTSTPSVRQALDNAYFFNTVKTAASDLATEIVLACLQLIGVAAYQEQPHSPYSLSRNVRDVLSGPLMVSNDRLRAAAGAAAFTARLPAAPARPTDRLEADGKT